MDFEAVAAETKSLVQLWTGWKPEIKWPGKMGKEEISTEKWSIQGLRLYSFRNLYVPEINIKDILYMDLDTPDSRYTFGFKKTSPIQRFHWNNKIGDAMD